MLTLVILEPLLLDFDMIEIIARSHSCGLWELVLKNADKKDK